MQEGLSCLGVQAASVNLTIKNACMIPKVGFCIYDLTAVLRIGMALRDCGCD